MANRVKEAREEKGWSQERLAYVAEVAVGTISRIENGRLPNRSTRRAIAAALETSVDDLFEFESQGAA